jgi:hypothetical protein
MGSNNSSSQSNNANTLSIHNLLNPLDLRDRNNNSNFQTAHNETEDINNHNNVQLLLEHQKSKPTKTYKNPIILLRSSLKLERDSANGNYYYYSFKYTSLLRFEAHFHLDSSYTISGLSNNPKLETKVLKNLTKANEENFLEKEAFLDYADFLEKKDIQNSDKNYYDLIIELKAFKDTGEEECSFLTYCNFVAYKVNESEIIKIKCEMQKLKVRNYLFEVFSIFGMDPSIDSSSNDCEACCTKKKNTIFLPCKHSYACSGCSVVVRMPNNQCPLCRQSVADCLIIE